MAHLKKAVLVVVLLTMVSTLLATAVLAQRPPAPARSAVILDITVSSEGQISAGGFTADELNDLAALVGISVPRLAPEAAAFLGYVGPVVLSSSPDGVFVRVGETKLVNVAWDDQGRKMALDTLQGLIDIQLEPNTRQAIENLMATTMVSLTFRATDKVSDPLEIELIEPLNIEVAADGSVRLQGIALPGVTIPQVAAITGQAGIENARLCWSDESLHWLINNRAMPAITTSEGALTEALRILGWQPLPVVNKLEQLLRNTAASIDVTFANGQPPTADCNYQFATSAPPPLKAGFDLVMTHDGQIRVGDNSFQLPIWIPPTVREIELTAEPGRVTTQVNSVAIQADFDQTSLENTAEIADAFGTGNALRTAASVLANTQIEARARFVEKPPQPPQEQKPAEAINTPPKAPEVSARAVHTIRAGDTLWSIWQTLGGKEGTGRDWQNWKEATMTANGLSYTGRIVILTVGQTLQLP